MMIKRKGERGSPWWILGEDKKEQEGTPLTKIEKKTDEVRLSI
jgi:hypothetical protein